MTRGGDAVLPNRVGEYDTGAKVVIGIVFPD